MHKGHVAGCLLAVAVALVVFSTTGGSIGGLGLLLAVLICPITMGLVMWFVMGAPRHETTTPPTEATPRRRTVAHPPTTHR